MRKHQQGFTLIEIAIVLVIIGLLLGGVLKGQELIESAKIKRVITDLNGTSAAFYGYQDRFNAIPGDDLAATVAARWPGILGDGTTPGGGDGTGALTGVYAAAAGAESTFFWQHLRAAGFVSGSLATGPISQAQPVNRYAGILGVEVTGNGLTGLIMCESNLTGKAAIAVDSQVDDGTGSAGTMRALLQAVGAVNPAVGAGPGVVYNDLPASRYLICKLI